MARFSENDPAAYCRSLKALVGWQVEDHLGRIDVPTLFVSSDNDYTPPALKRQFASVMPNASVEVVTGAYHAVNLERPQAFNATVDRFLGGLGPSPETPAA